jgi:hypothetical protein
MKYIKLFESFIAEVAGYPLVAATSAVKGWADQGDGTWMVKCTLGRIYIATAETKNNGNVSVFLTANDPETIKKLQALGCTETAPASGVYKLVDKDKSEYAYNKMFSLTLTDVKTGDPILVSIANVLNKVQAAAPAQVAVDYTGLKNSTTANDKVKALQTAIIASGNTAAAKALTDKGGATGIYGPETAAAIGILIGTPTTPPSEITKDINTKIQAKLTVVVNKDAGQKYADNFFGKIVDPNDPTKTINVGDVIRTQQAADKAAADKAATVTTTTKKP